MYLHHYYTGLNYISNQAPEVTWKEKGWKEKHAPGVLKWVKFVKDNPRCEKVVSKIGILRSKGCYWKGPMSCVPWTPEERKSNWVHMAGLGKYYFKGFPFKEEADYPYLDIFFPKFSDDTATLTANWFTGTPYGPVDIIYPMMRLEDMKKYNSIIFLGYNRMDLVREDFLNDLIKYVKDGGMVLLSIDQLKDIKDKIDVEKLDNFLGARIGSEVFPNMLPKKRITNYIEVIEATPFNLNKKSYKVSDKIGLLEGGTDASTSKIEHPYLYKTTPKEAKVIARDKENNPVLLLNKYGKGYIFLFTTPTLSMIPPVGKSPFVSDVINKVSSFKPLPVDISPENEDVEFILSKTGDKEATIFVMNHGEKDYEGDIIVNLKAAGLSKGIGKKITAKVVTGYDNIKDITPEVIREGNKLVIKGITLKGDTKDFCSYRQASFAYIKMGK